MKSSVSFRKSDGKADAAKKIMRKFPADGSGGGLDDEQTDAILELKLYRLARLEINLIIDELKEKNKRARQIRKFVGRGYQRHEFLRSMADRP